MNVMLIYACLNEQNDSLWEEPVVYSPQQFQLQQ